MIYSNTHLRTRETLPLRLKRYRKHRPIHPSPSRISRDSSDKEKKIILTFGRMFGVVIASLASGEDLTDGVEDLKQTSVLTGSGSGSNVMIVEKRIFNSTVLFLLVVKRILNRNRIQYQK